MENISIAIVTSDREYGRALGLSLLNIYRTFSVRIMTARRCIEERSYVDYDLVLWDGEEIKKSYGGNIIYMSDRPSATIKNFRSRKFSLYKYKTSQSMVGDLLEIYSFLTGRKACYLFRDHVRILGFASWHGGSGCTSVAMSVGQHMCRFRDMKIIYISFENLESTAEFMDCTNPSRDVGEYLYTLFKEQKEPYIRGQMKKQEGLPFLESFIVRDSFGMEAFSPRKGANPLINLTGDQAQQFIMSLVESGRYDGILLDLGYNLGESAVAALKMAEKICMVTMSQKKTHRESQYMKNIIYACDDGITEKMLRLDNGIDEKEIDETLDMDMSGGRDHICRFRTQSGMGGIGTPRLEGEYGRDIERITDRILMPKHGE